MTVTEIGGSRAIVPEPLFELSAWLVAVTVTVCWLLIVAGAVYSPVVLLIVPAPVAGLTVQVTAVLLVLATVAENCCVPPP